MNNYSANVVKIPQYKFVGEAAALMTTTKDGHDPATEPVFSAGRDRILWS